MFPQNANRPPRGGLPVAASVCGSPTRDQAPRWEVPALVSRLRVLTDSKALIGHGDTPFPALQDAAASSLPEHGTPEPQSPRMLPHGSHAACSITRCAAFYQDMPGFRNREKGSTMCVMNERAP